ncbi:hypothetical protein BGX28_000093 [Mortierella sp. GBA30]|nr:hypothetical protein BGX28_000093 [Mortierella sp. GBA30]
MGWTPMEPNLDTCGMTNWVGSFDPVKFIYFMLATVLIPYPAYVVVATIFNLEHRAKRPARHYQDLLNATSYGVIVFIFGNYARTLKSWPFGMYALFAGATAVVLAFAGYHIYLGVVLNRTVPGFVGYYLLGLLIPVALTLIGYACLKQQNKDLFGLSKVYNWMLHMQWKRSAYVTRQKAEKQKKLNASRQQRIDPPHAAEAGAAGESPSSASAQKTGIVLVQLEDQQQQRRQQPSNHFSRMGSHENLVLIDSHNNKLNSFYGATAASTEQRAEVEIEEPEILIESYQPYVWSAATPGYFHPHHWQLFYILAFFTRFEDWVSQVAAGITLGCYMQGIMAYGYDYLIEE